VAEPDLAELTWRRSSVCDDSNCVEVALTSKVVMVRDSMDRGGKLLTFSHPEWGTFLRHVRNNYSLSTCRQRVT
jgi:hypothetical protein